MRKTIFGILITLIFLAGCARPVPAQPQPEAQQKTESAETVSAPAPIEAETVAEEKEEAQEKETESRILFGRYEQDSNFENGPEPLEWIVLAEENGKQLLVTSKVIDMQPYDYSMGMLATGEKGKRERRVKSKEKLTWEDSTVRKWLNQTFLLESFSDLEQERVDGEVFLLSEDEWNRYPAVRESTAEMTEYCRQLEMISYGWMLKDLTKTENEWYVTVIKDNNTVSRGEAPAQHGVNGIRPAVWIQNLS